MRALCGASGQPRPTTPAGCVVSVRLSDDGRTIEEFYDISGSPSFTHGRRLFFAHHRYDAVLFVHDATDPATRASLSTIWVPHVMEYLGDVGAILSGGRLDGHDVHVRSSAVLSELRFLWRQALFSHGALSLREAATDAVRLFARLARLVMNETGLWPDSEIDLRAEAAFLSTSLVPTAIVAMKTDLVDRDDTTDTSTPSDRSARAVPHMRLHVHNVAHDARLRGFLRRAADAARRRTVTVKQSTNSHNNSPHVMLGFV